LGKFQEDKSPLTEGRIMEPFFLFCAVIGGTVFVGQFLLSAIGLAGDHDLSGDVGGDHFDTGGHDGAASEGHHEASSTEHESATSWFVGLLSFRTIVAGLTFFGLAGLATEASGAGAAGSLTVAAVAGMAALYVVAWTMRGINRLRADGTVHIENTVGQTATVYLTIPGHHTGKGKVTVTVQNRTMEYEAETAHDSLATGSLVTVAAVVGTDTVDVVPAPELSRTSHA
jgi:hypothetical protein